MMHRTSCLCRVVGALAVSGFLTGCGADGTQASSPESKAGETAVAKSTIAKLRLPKNVNPNASNRGIKGKYAD
jgi:hypothetical protein